VTRDGVDLDAPGDRLDLDEAALREGGDLDGRA
jgi:hypothetical protein